MIMAAYILDLFDVFTSTQTATRIPATVIDWIFSPVGITYIRSFQSISAPGFFAGYLDYNLHEHAIKFS